MCKYPVPGWSERQSCFWFADSSSESWDQVYMSRSSGRGQGHRSKKSAKSHPAIPSVTHMVQYCCIAVVASPFFSLRVWCYLATSMWGTVWAYGEGGGGRLPAWQAAWADFKLLIHSRYRQGAWTSNFQSADRPRNDRECLLYPVRGGYAFCWKAVLLIYVTVKTVDKWIVLFYQIWISNKESFCCKVIGWWKCCNKCGNHRGCTTTTIMKPPLKLPVTTKYGRR